MRGQTLNLLYIFGFLLLFSSCNKTNKSALTQGYHDLTSHYNSNWNANDKYKTAVKNINHKPGDDFDSLINLYSYENKAAAAVFGGDYDAIIKKATTSIQQHAISKWSDDNFFLMGMAHYLKGDYLKSADHFQYITSEYKTGYKDEFVNKDKLKKRAKKEREKKIKLKEKIKKEKKTENKTALKEALNARPHEKKLGAHPARSASVIMLARSYIKNQELDKAQSVLTFIEADRTIPDNYMTDFKLAQAEYFIASASEIKAIAPLKLAISEIKKKKERARPNYVLAQLYERNGFKDSAAAAYSAVLKCNPDYNMEFNAKLKIAELAAAGSSALEAKSILIKMARDGKNADMLDQIYYQLGRIYQNENNLAEAIVNYKKSLAKNKSNAKQKGLTYIALADIYYNDEAYRDARNYYDSTLTIINNKIAQYSIVKERSNILSNLVTQLNIIETEDSLQMIAKLGDAERKKRVSDIVFNELKAKEKEKEDKLKIESSALVSKLEVDDPSASFYFYNQNSRNKGYSAFKKTWGERKLEDNWRRGEKSFDASSSGTAGSSDTGSSDNVVSFEQKKEIDRINKLLPTSEDQIKKSNDRMIDAYFLLANAYKDDFNNLVKSIETFEKLLARFPANKYEVECYYNLYLLYGKTNNGPKATANRDKILKDFAASKFAQAINDPKAVSKVKSNDEVALEYYNTTYDLYSTKQYDQVISRSKEAIVKFKGTKLEASFAFLGAVSLGYTKKLDEYSIALDKFIKTYPTHPLKDKAAELMLYLSDIDKYRKEDSIASIGKAPDIIKSVVKDSVEVKKADIKKVEEVKEIIKEDSKKDKKDKKDKKIKEHFDDSLAAYTDSMAIVIRTDSLVKQGDLMPAGMDLSKFTRDEKAIHRLIIKPVKVDLANIDLINRIKEFDNKTPANKRLTVSNLLLNAETKIIVVKEFLDEASAMTYYNSLIASEDFLKGLNKKDYKIFVITAKNQSVAVGGNLLNEAYWFFKSNYPK
jgi:tetratricopeptide (TPR) repeat protein